MRPGWLSVIGSPGRGYGAFAEEIVVPVGGLARIADGIDDLTAAAFGVAYRTAYHTLRSVARVRSGDDVVVLGAGGGWAWPRSRWPRCSARPSPRWRHRRKSSMQQDVTGPHTS